MFLFFSLLVLSLVVRIDQVNSRAANFIIIFFIPFTWQMDCHDGVFRNIERLTKSDIWILHQCTFRHCPDIENSSYNAKKKVRSNLLPSVFAKLLILLRPHFQKLIDSGLCRSKELKKSCSTAVQRGVGEGGEATGASAKEMGSSRVQGRGQLVWLSLSIRLRESSGSPNLKGETEA